MVIVPVKDKKNNELSTTIELKKKKKFKMFSAAIEEKLARTVAGSHVKTHGSHFLHGLCNVVGIAMTVGVGGALEA